MLCFEQLRKYIDDQCCLDSNSCEKKILHSKKKKLFTKLKIMLAVLNYSVKNCPIGLHGVVLSDTEDQLF